MSIAGAVGKGTLKGVWGATKVVGSGVMGAGKLGVSAASSVLASGSDTYKNLEPTLSKIGNYDLLSMFKKKKGDPDDPPGSPPRPSPTPPSPSPRPTPCPSPCPKFPPEIVTLLVKIEKNTKNTLGIVEDMAFTINDQIAEITEKSYNVLQLHTKLLEKIAAGIGGKKDEKGGIGKLLLFIAPVFAMITNAFTKFGKMFTTGGLIGKGLSWATTAFGTLFTDMKKGIKGAIKNLGGGIKSAFTKVRNGIGGAMSSLAEKVGSLFQKVTGSFKAAAEKVSKFFSNIFGFNADKGAAKAAEKGAAKAAEKGTVKAAEKAAAKGVGKSLIKKIPLVGAIAGLGFGAQRAWGGDWAGAGMEVASGLAGTVPGIGTAASLGIDAGLIARDMKKESDAPAPITKPGLVPPTPTTTVSKPEGVSPTENGQSYKEFFDDELKDFDEDLHEMGLEADKENFEDLTETYKDGSDATVESIDKLNETTMSLPEKLAELLRSGMDFAKGTYKNMTASPEVVKKNADFVESLKEKDPYMYQLAMKESSGGKNLFATTSSASGAFQFLDSTWQDTVKKMGKDYTLEDKLDPEKAYEVAKFFDQQNRQGLQKATGKDVSDKDAYMAHFLGQGGASKFLSNYDPNNPNQTGVELAGADAAEANRSIFYDKDGKARSSKDVYASLTKSFSGAEGNAATTMLASNNTTKTEQLAKSNTEAKQAAAQVAPQVAVISPPAQQSAPASGGSSSNTTVNNYNGGTEDPIIRRLMGEMAMARSGFGVGFA